MTTYTDEERQFLVDKGIGMPLSKWDKRFLALAEHIASWSKDSRQVGAVIVRGNQVVSVGYNGFPTGVADDSRLADKPTKLQMTIHAEENAILSAKQDVSGCSIFITSLPPCPSCASKIIQAGISRVIFFQPTEHHADKYNLPLTLSMFSESGTQYLIVDKETVKT